MKFVNRLRLQFSRDDDLSITVSLDVLDNEVVDDRILRQGLPYGKNAPGEGPKVVKANF